MIFAANWRYLTCQLLIDGDWLRAGMNRTVRLGCNQRQRALFGNELNVSAGLGNSNP